MWCASSWTTQNSDHPGDYWSNSRTNLGRNAWTRIKNVNGASSQSKYWNFFGVTQMISCRNLVISPWPRDKANQQSMEWWHSGSPRPKEFREQKFAGKVLASIFGIKTTPSSLIIFQRAKLSTRSITHLSWCNWRTFGRKNAAGKLTRGSSSCTTTPRLTGHLQPRRNWHTWVSIVLITNTILRIWPRRTTACSLDWKSNWNFAIFRPTRRSLLPRRPGWTDNLLIFFLVACRS